MKKKPKRPKPRRTKTTKPEPRKPDLTATKVGRNVLVLRMDELRGGWEQWFLLRSDAHHDNKYCRQDIEKAHLEEAKAKNAPSPSQSPPQLRHCQDATSSAPLTRRGCIAGSTHLGQRMPISVPSDTGTTSVAFASEPPPTSSRIS